MALAGASCLLDLLGDLGEEIFSDVDDEDGAVVEFGDFEGHLSADAHAGARDNDKTVFVEFKGWFFADESEDEVEENDGEGDVSAN